MGTTLDDIAYEEYLEEQAKNGEVNELIQSRKGTGLLFDRTKEIFNYLPIRRITPEDNYIKHLWDAYITLDSFGKNGREFLTMPFHLLFMLSLQYKVLRLTKFYPRETKLFFSGVNCRDKTKILSPDLSVFNIGLINERSIPEIFQLIDTKPEIIKKIKLIVDDRNDQLAHAKGGIEPSPEDKINQYLDVLEKIQKTQCDLNLKCANDWLEETKTKIDVDQFIEYNLLDSHMTPNDFGDCIFILLNSRRFSLSQFDQLINKGLTISFDKTLIALASIALENDQASRRFKALEALNENNMISPELRTIILKKETDPKIKLLLK